MLQKDNLRIVINDAVSTIPLGLMASESIAHWTFGLIGAKNGLRRIKVHGSCSTKYMRHECILSKPQLKTF